jgi:hypothetical protein
MIATLEPRPIAPTPGIGAPVDARPMGDRYPSVRKLPLPDPRRAS